MIGNPLVREPPLFALASLGASEVRGAHKAVFALDKALQM
jgi:hypothetical protein